MDKKWPDSRCATCQFLREVGSKRGSVFWMCQKSEEDPAFTKYPPQPVWWCSAYKQKEIDP